MLSASKKLTAAVFSGSVRRQSRIVGSFGGQQMRFSTDLYQRDFSTISAELARSRTEVVHIVDQQVPQTPHLRYPETGTVGVNPFTVSDKALWTDGNTFVDEAGRRIEMALLERQRKVEGEQLEEAVKVYSENFDHMTKMGRGTHMKNTQRLLLGWYEPLVAAIYKEFESIAMGEKGIDRQQYAPYLVQLPVEKLAVITLTTTLNNVLRSGNAGEKLAVVAMDIANMLETETRLAQIKSGRKSAASWHKHLSKNIPIGSQRELLAFNKRLASVTMEEEWTVPAKLKVGSALIKLLINSATHDGEPGFIHKIDFHYVTGHAAKRLGTISMNPLKFLEFSNLSNKDSIYMMPRLLPMLVPPRPWSNREYKGAYYTTQAPIMKASTSQQSVAVRHASMDPVLESLDYLGSQGWRVNPLIRTVINELVEKGISIAELPSRADVPLPTQDQCCRPVKDILSDSQSYMARLLNRAKMQALQRADAKNHTSATSIDLHSLTLDELSQPAKIPLFALIPEATRDSIRKLAVSMKELKQLPPDTVKYDKNYQVLLNSRIGKKNAELHSLRCDLDIKMGIANKFKDDVVYFPHNIDFRGRAYPVPPNLSHMGNDVCRGMMIFDKAKPLGPNGLNWLKVHLANLFGHNKVSMNDRIAWAEAHMEEIRDSAAAPVNGQRWWASAESPFQALAVCDEICKAIDSGNPETYECRLPVHQDGSCNGLQHYAGLGRDAQGGASVNLVPHDTPQDVYSRVLTKVLERLEQDATAADDDPRAADGRRDKARILHEQKLVNRKVIKQTVMTSVYGVTTIGARAQVEARLVEAMKLDLAEAIDKEREVYQMALYLANLTLQSLSEMFSSAKSIMDWLGECSRLVAMQNQSMSWITPLGLPVVQPYRKVHVQVVKTVMQTFSLAASSDLLPVAPRKQRTAFPPNFVHSLDATHMMLTAKRMKDLGLSFAAVHDSYWTHACDVPVMSEVLREAFVELYSQPLLENLYESLVTRFPSVDFPPIPDRGTLDVNLVKDSRYFFH